MPPPIALPSAAGDDRLSAVYQLKIGEHQKVWGSWGQQLLRLTWEAVPVGKDHDPTTCGFNS